MDRRIGILLAGGLSRRYGSPKAFAEMNGKKFYEMVYGILQSVCDQVIIVTRKEFIDWFPDKYHVIVDVDDFSGCGPLAGIYSAMVEKEAENYVVLPCDMPLMTSQVMKKLVTLHANDVTVVCSEGYLQPLVSTWSKNVKKDIYTALDKGKFKMTDVLETVDTDQIDGDKISHSPLVFMNINTPEEDKEMRRWKGS